MDARNQMLGRVAMWLSLLATASLYRAWCGFDAFDVGASFARRCWVEAPSASCLAPTPFCPDAPLVRALAPSWLARVVSLGGPMLLWVPLWLLTRAVRAAPVDIALWSALGVYFVATPILRFLPIWLAFDPSGHTLMYGIQLVPWWVALFFRPGTDRLRWPETRTEPPLSSSSSASKEMKAAGRLSWVRFHRLPTVPSALFQGGGLVLELLFFWMSFTTATFFHTTAEVFAASIPIVGLVMVTLRRVSRVAETVVDDTATLSATFSATATATASPIATATATGHTNGSTVAAATVATEEGFSGSVASTAPFSRGSRRPAAPPVSLPTVADLHADWIQQCLSLYLIQNLVFLSLHVLSWISDGLLSPRPDHKVPSAAQVLGFLAFDAVLLLAVAFSSPRFRQRIYVIATSLIPPR